MTMCCFVITIGPTGHDTVCKKCMYALTAFTTASPCIIFKFYRTKFAWKKKINAQLQLLSFWSLLYLAVVYPVLRKHLKSLLALQVFRILYIHEDCIGKKQEASTLPLLEYVLCWKGCYVLCSQNLEFSWSNILWLKCYIC